MNRYMYMFLSIEITLVHMYMFMSMIACPAKSMYTQHGFHLTFSQLATAANVLNWQEMESLTSPGDQRYIATVAMKPSG